MTPNNPSHPTDYPTLYRLAFARYHTIALWNMAPVEDPTPADALAITRALRTHAGLGGRLLAEQIEQIAQSAKQPYC
jgi:hypothetical protein